VRFGQKPLSHPLLVDAMENEFIPVAVHNNREGKDATILVRFGEPAWNNPVLRFLDAEGRDIVPRRDRIRSSEDVATRLVEVLVAAGREVPDYLRLALRELECASTDLAIAPGQPVPIGSKIRDAKPSDDKYRFKETALRFVPLTPMQATEINASLGRKEDPLHWLSPRQRVLAKKIEAAIKNKPNVLDHLEPPRSTDGLAAYEKELLAALAAVAEK